MRDRGKTCQFRIILCDSRSSSVSKLGPRRGNHVSLEPALRNHDTIFAIMTQGSSLSPHNLSFAKHALVRWRPTTTAKRIPVLSLSQKRSVLDSNP